MEKEERSWGRRKGKRGKKGNKDWKRKVELGVKSEKRREGKKGERDKNRKYEC